MSQMIWNRAIENAKRELRDDFEKKIRSLQLDYLAQMKVLDELDQIRGSGSSSSNMSSQQLRQLRDNGIRPVSDRLSKNVDKMVRELENNSELSAPAAATTFVDSPLVKNVEFERIRRRTAGSSIVQRKRFSDIFSSHNSSGVGSVSSMNDVVITRKQPDGPVKEQMPKERRLSILSRDLSIPPPPDKKDALESLLGSIERSLAAI